MDSAENRTDLNDLYDETDEDTQKDKYLTFRIGKESYGIEIRHVTEIGVMQEITEVPDMPDCITGVINLRGNVISVMNVRSRFGLESKEYDERTCIIVVDINNLSVGLIVDTVNEVLSIPEDQIDPPPKTHSGIKSSYIQGMGKVEGQVKILLDVEKILYEEELQQLEQA
jgi:purine-binding chemotaxis protein CheW